eukprot:g24638.t1
MVVSVGRLPAWRPGWRRPGRPESGLHAQRDGRRSAVFKLAAKKADKAAMQDAKKDWPMLRVGSSPVRTPVLGQECLRDLPQASEWSDTKRQLCCDMMGLGCEKPVVSRTEDKEDQEEADDDSQAVVFRLQDETIPVNEPFQLPLKVAVTTDANTKLTTSATLERPAALLDELEGIRQVQLRRCGALLLVRHSSGAWNKQAQDPDHR